MAQEIFDILPVGVWIADRDGRITLSNRAGDRIWRGNSLRRPEQFGEYKAWWVETGKPISAEEWGIARAIRYGETSRGRVDPNSVLRWLIQDDHQLGGAHSLGWRRGHRRDRGERRRDVIAVTRRSNCVQQCAIAKTFSRSSRTICAIRSPRS